MRMPDEWFLHHKLTFLEFKSKFLSAGGSQEHLTVSYGGYLRKWRKINGDSDVHKKR